mgnify:CR=1 FL=1
MGFPFREIIFTCLGHGIIMTVYKRQFWMKLSRPRLLFIVIFMFFSITTIHFISLVLTNKLEKKVKILKLTYDEKWKLTPMGVNLSRLIFSFKTIKIEKPYKLVTGKFRLHLSPGIYDPRFLRIWLFTRDFCQGCEAFSYDFLKFSEKKKCNFSFVCYQFNPKLS